MTQPPAVSVELANFIREALHFPPDRKIRHDEQLEFDFGLEGDPADDFMYEFGKHFDVKPGDFDFQRYFEFEGLAFPRSLSRWWLKKRGFPSVRKEVLTVEMLQRAIEAGVWDSERLRQIRDDSREPNDPRSKETP